MFLSRRQFLKVSAGTVAAVALADKALALTALQPVIKWVILSGNILIGHGSGFITINIDMTVLLPGYVRLTILMPAGSVRLSGMVWSCGLSRTMTIKRMKTSTAIVGRLRTIHGCV